MKKKKILVLVANSNNTSPQQFEEQVREIDNELQRARHRDQFELEQKWAVRPRDIQRAMLDVRPQIVHFLGDRVADSKRGNREKESVRKLVPLVENAAKSEGLVFEDETGQAKPVSGEALVALFELFADTLECVVLNDYYSEIQAKAIARHIKFVVGMKQAITEKAALEFAVGFYDALGAGHPFNFAFNSGCTAIQMAGMSEHLTPVLYRDKISLPPVKTSESESLEDHYQSVIRAITKGQMVPFLGSDINLCGRPIQKNGKPEPWETGCPYPPSSMELAAYLARTFPPQPEKVIRLLHKQESETKTDESLEKSPTIINEVIHEHAILICTQNNSKGSLHVGGELIPYLSQYACLTREGEFYDKLHQLLHDLDYQPNQLHKFFATLPAIMREKKYYPPYPLIVTTNYDLALEKAFEEAQEPFDLVFYSNAIDAQEQDLFVHRKPDGTLEKIEHPSEYQKLSFEQRPVILKLYGTADQIQEEECLVITEEHYIEYLVSRDISKLLPVQIRKKIRFRRPNILFLGYPLGDWHQRIILHRISQNLTSTKRGNRWWAIQSNAEPFARKLWESYDVVLYDVPLKDYITELDQRIQKIPAKGDKGYE